MESTHKVFDYTPSFESIIEKSSEPSLDLRPKSFADYPGQEHVCENLKVYVEAARISNKMLDHCLFYGPPGLGKTTLATILANEMQCQIKVTSAPVIEKSADLMGILAGLEPNVILFIDEIHRLAANIEEILYSAMDDRKIDILVGQGPNTRSVKFDLPSFTLIGATTRPGALSGPLLSRFGISEKLEFYSVEALQTIINRSAKLMQIQIDSEATIAIAKRCRGTPRIANILLKRVLDFAIVARKENIENELVESSLARLGIDSAGLARMDREILRIILERYNKGPVGLEAIAAAMNEDRSTLEDVHEPYLVYIGFISRTGRGRMLTNAAIEHLKNVEDNFGKGF